MFPKETKFLIVDDMRSMLDLIHVALKKLGYENIVEASEGKEALELLKKNQRMATPINVVLCDWNLPKMMGIDILKAVREVPEWEFLPFIMITTESEKAQILEALASGVTDYIVKPFSLAVLQGKLVAAYKRSLDQNKTS